MGDFTDPRSGTLPKNAQSTFRELSATTSVLQGRTLSVAIARSKKNEQA
ncbi:MAG: hypothetical protein H6617_01970 [Bdellovibrionaceae bacterium]|nr:hypothetical protein [Pseudobdellovibrionaceae bacterium]